MLVLSRRIGEKIVIGDGIVVTVVEVHRDSVRLGVDAPRSVPVNRAELLQAVSEENVAAMSNPDAAVALSSLKGIKPKSGSPLDLKKLMQSSSLASSAKASTSQDSAPASKPAAPASTEAPKPSAPAPGKSTPKPHPPIS
ncbi:MAG: carbon storage regulator CsrA [Mobiluncus porci]|uniref:Translational regulator CsrA n=1 Tax=Mobiluncus porci TaxID=2652278 RepID=A0A7K0K688_9ACTO|nr:MULTISPECIES: carbon storage regulator CsrA [Mobiluncus]MCI6584723.1 carbon storage regulator CsrA [Mobiluncus sp.]MDD7540970.1 carbon storage regulator CsrA [Mobiluncus porci]MDY5748145.1 carbon storage regulator CsrA [Mobiluncus porci]MST50535.1 carbon storage regulator CsrA [Mobiluncus porci]